MTVLATDDFNRANGALGANWATITGMGAPTIVSNKVEVTTVGTDAAARYSGVAVPNNQYAQCKIMTNIGAGRANGPAVRCASGTATYYNALGGFNPLGASTLLEIGSRVAGVYSQISSTTQPLASGDVIRIEVSGNLISAYINGVLKYGPTSDGAIASGSFGIAIFVDAGTAADSELDDFEGGDLTTAGPTGGAKLVRRQTSFGLL